MSADKSKADRLAESAHLGYRVQWQREAAAELRRIPALEAERDILRAEVMEQARLLGMSGERELALRAQIDRLRKDADRLDWLADPENTIGNVQLPSECVLQNLHSLRDAIDAARKLK